MAVEKNIKINVETGDAIEKVDELKQGVQETSQTASDSKKSFGKMKSGVNAVGTAFKALGIGLIVAAFVKLKDMLSQNQVVMDKLSIAGETLNFMFQKVVDVAIQFGQKVTKAFSDPKQAIKDLWTALKENIVNRIEGLIDLFGAFGRIIKGVFTRDLDLIKEAASDAGTAFVQLGTGLDEVQQSKVADTMTKVWQETKKAAKEANEYGKAITNLRKEVKLAEANQRQLQLTYQKDAELQRQIRDDVSRTIEERIEANEELGRVLQKQFEEEKALAQKKIDLAQMEFDQNQDNVDLEVALINAKTEMADLEERITGQKSEQMTNLNALEKERADAIQATADAQKKADEQAIADAKKQTEIEKREAEKREQIAEAEKMAKINAGKNLLTAIGQFAGEGSKIAKATALTNILIDTALSISGAIKAAQSVPFPGNLVAIATGVTSVLAGIANAKQILSKATGSDGGGDSSVSVAGAGATPAPSGVGPLVPNVAGIGGGGDTASQPVQAYVVENDISNQQALQEELEVQSTL